MTIAQFISLPLWIFSFAAFVVGTIAVFNPKVQGVSFYLASLGLPVSSASAYLAAKLIGVL